MFYTIMYVHWSMHAGHSLLDLSICLSVGLFARRLANPTFNIFQTIQNLLHCGKFNGQKQLKCQKGQWILSPTR